MSNYLKSVIFALTTAVVCSFLLTAAAAGLKKFQLENVEVDQKKNILKAVGLVESDTAYSKEQIKTIYQDNIRSFYVTTDGVVMEKDDRVEKNPRSTSSAFSDFASFFKRSFRRLIENQLPHPCNGIVTDNIGGIIIPDNFEIAMIRTLPTINHLLDLDFVCVHQDMAGSFFTPVAGI